MKQRIRLSESDLHRMIKESVKQVLKENIDQFGTIMQTACAYMEEFRMGDLSDIVFHYEYNKPTQVINALLTARDKARKYMEMGADDADDFYNAVNNAYMEFSKKVLTTNNASQNESRLKQTIRESVRQVLRESIHKEEVFTISAYDIVNDTEINDFSYDHDFYNKEEAIESAIEYAQSLVDEENVIIITVFGGEFCDENGNVTGEPFDIFTVSNKDKQTTAIARNRCGYTNLKVDYYVI